MAFWRRRREPEPEVTTEPAAPEPPAPARAVEADRHPTPPTRRRPAAVAGAGPRRRRRRAGRRTRNFEVEVRRRRPRRPEPPPDPAPAYAPFDPTAFLAVVPEGSLETGLEKTRTGLVTQLRGFLGNADGPQWDEVEETLIAGDVGAALSIDLVERARKRRDPGGPEAAIRAELAALLVDRDVDWQPALRGRGRARGRARRRRQRHRQDDDDRQAGGPLRRRRAGASSWPLPTRSARPPSISSGSGPTVPRCR